MRAAHCSDCSVLPGRPVRIGDRNKGEIYTQAEASPPPVQSPTVGINHPDWMPHKEDCLLCANIPAHVSGLYRIGISLNAMGPV